MGWFLLFCAGFALPFEGFGPHIASILLMAAGIAGGCRK